MSKYKVAFKADWDTAGSYALGWEPECPVQITAVQISRNVESSATFLQVKVRNVSSECISSIVVELEARLLTGETERTSLEYLDVDIAAAAEVTLKPRQLAHANVTACKLAVKRVDSSTETWQSTDSAKPLPARKELQLSPKALKQRARALGGKTSDPVAKGAIQSHKTWWVCACGQVNVKRDNCCACGSEKHMLLENEDEAKLLKDADAYSERTYREAIGLGKEGARTADLQKAISLLESIPDWKDAESQVGQYRRKLAEEETSRHKRVRKTAIAATSALLSIVAIIALVVFIIVPIAQYNRAVQFVDEANFEAAVDLASEIGGIKSSDAQSLKKTAQYQYAVNNLDRENETTYEYLKELRGEDYEDSGSLFDEYFSPKVEIALVEKGSEPVESDWSNSPVIAEMKERKHSFSYSESEPYDCWIRVYCPVEETLEIDFLIRTLTKDDTIWSISNLIYFDKENSCKHTFYPGVTSYRLEFANNRSLQLEHVYGKNGGDEVVACITASTDGNTLCEKELRSPDYSQP